MPKKTKKQKLHAQLHTAHSSKPSSSVVSEYELSKEEQETAQYVVKDLRKTLLITVLILSIEFLVFYASLRGVRL